MKTQKVEVKIKRGDSFETFYGTLVGEATSFYQVEWKNNQQNGGIEWFAKSSRMVSCTLL